MEEASLKDPGGFEKKAVRRAREGVRGHQEVMTLG